MSEVSPIDNVKKIDIPVLLIHGRDDSVVDYYFSRKFEKAMRKANKDVRLISLENEDHWFSLGESRRQMLTETLAFIDAHIGE